VSRTISASNDAMPRSMQTQRQAQAQTQIDAARRAQACAAGNPKDAAYDPAR
jgi:hypothetical protein